MSEELILWEAGLLRLGSAKTTSPLELLCPTHHLPTVHSCVGLANSIVVQDSGVSQSCQVAHVCACAPQPARRSQRTTLGVTPCLPSCLRQGVSLTLAYARLAGLQAFGESPVSTSYPNTGVLGYRHSCVQFSQGPKDPNSGPHVGAASVLSTEPSPLPQEHSSGDSVALDWKSALPSVNCVMSASQAPGTR